MKGLFLRRTPRERFLFLLFLAAAAVVWLVAAADRLQARRTDGRLVAGQLETQQFWLDQKAEIDARAAKAGTVFDRARTLDATRLVGEVSALARAAGLTPATESPRTQRTGQFAYHTVQVSFNRADLAALIKFYRALGQRAPYLALEEVSLVANRSNPAEIDARFTVFSVETPR
jgi:hypothetical protein